MTWQRASAVANRAYGAMGYSIATGEADNARMETRKTYRRITPQGPPGGRGGGQTARWETMGWALTPQAGKHA